MASKSLPCQEVSGRTLCTMGGSRSDVWKYQYCLSAERGIIHRDKNNTSIGRKAISLPINISRKIYLYFYFAGWCLSTPLYTWPPITPVPSAPFPVHLTPLTIPSSLPYPLSYVIALDRGTGEGGGGGLDWGTLDNYCGQFMFFFFLSFYIQLITFSLTSYCCNGAAWTHRVKCGRFKLFFFFLLQFTEETLYHICFFP